MSGGGEQSDLLSDVDQITTPVTTGYSDPFGPLGHSREDTNIGSQDIGPIDKESHRSTIHFGGVSQR